jgi:hypothetical protein
MATQQQQQMSASQINSLARQAIKARGVRMLQQIFSQQYTTPLPTQVTVNPRNVGLLLGFWVKVTGTITNTTAASNLTLSDFGPANMLSQIQFYDLSNNVRIQTPGWHLNFINSWKAKRIFGSSLIGASGTNTGLQIASTFPTTTFQGEDSPTNYGSNWTINSAPASIAEGGGTGVVTQWYYVPLAYNPDNPQNPDFRGAVYANVVNATMQLILSLPGTYGSQLAAAYGTDSTSAVYFAAANHALTAALSPLTITVYQDYYDQLPVGNNGVLLPILDLATIYELKYTNVTAISANQDFPYQYANFRDFLSTTAVYVNTAATGARGTGADINTWALQSANFTNIWKTEPNLQALFTRRHIGADLPPGTYLFDSRDRPISTTQYGNMQLVLNAATAGTGAYMLIGVEDFSLVQSLSMAGSLAAS